MAYIPRQLESSLAKRLFHGKALILYGPRQCGKTTLIKHLLAPHERDVLWLNGDNPDTKNMLSGISVAVWKRVIGSRKILVVDEAQRIENIGISLKLVIDEFPSVQVIATGSSSFELMSRTAEPLTGRKFEYRLLPLSFSELGDHYGYYEEKQERERRMLYGSYPDIINHPGDEQSRLEELAGSYLFKDIYALDGLKKSSLVEKLISAVAMQLGSEVSFNELAGIVGTDNRTAERYIDLLSKCYIVFPLKAYSRNLRNEIKKRIKIYFYDLGIRNAVINNFSPLASRQDAGGMWENYLIMERLKRNINHPFHPHPFFWRTQAPLSQEIDYLEEGNGKLQAWEIKSNPQTKARIPLTFRKAYPEAQTSILSPDNYDEFLLP